MESCIWGTMGSLIKVPSILHPKMTLCGQRGVTMQLQIRSAGTENPGLPKVPSFKPEVVQNLALCAKPTA